MGVCNKKKIITKNGNEIMDKCRHMSIFCVCVCINIICIHCIVMLLTLLICPLVFFYFFFSSFFLHK